jgi:hypothetical protein
MAEDRNVLRTAVAKYAQIDDQIQEINRRIHALRTERSVVEIEIGDILRSPEYATYNKLSHGNTEIVVKRPHQWTMPWSLSKTGLVRYADAYKRSATVPTVDGFLVYLSTVYGQTRVSDRFSLIRSSVE